MSLEVIWNGSHRDCDADLLCEGIRIAAKRPAVAVKDQPTHRHGCVAAVCAALPTSRQRARTFRELVAVTGYSVTQVNLALLRLRQAGELRSVPVAEMPDRGRPPSLYWRQQGQMA